MEVGRAADGQRKADAVVSKAAIRAMNVLGLTQRELGNIVGVHESTISRVAAGAATLSAESKSGELALLVIRMFRSLDALVGSDSMKARAWLVAPNEALGGTPKERIQTVEGLVSVAHYLDAMRGKL